MISYSNSQTRIKMSSLNKKNGLYKAGDLLNMV
jgi:hypothetical protein